MYPIDSYYFYLFLREKIMTVAITFQYPKETQWQENYQILTEQIENLRAYLVLPLGTRVTDGTKIGTIIDKKISLTDHPEFVVLWSEKLTKIEEPRRLKLEPIINPTIGIGDMIIINSKHQTQAEESFEIKEFQGNGWVLTTTDQRFHSDYFYAFRMVNDR